MSFRYADVRKCSLWCSVLHPNSCRLVRCACRRSCMGNVRRVFRNRQQKRTILGQPLPLAHFLNPEVGTSVPCHDSSQGTDKETLLEGQHALFSSEGEPLDDIPPMPSPALYLVVDGRDGSRWSPVFWPSCAFAPSSFSQWERRTLWLFLWFVVIHLFLFCKEIFYWTIKFLN